MKSVLASIVSLALNLPAWSATGPGISDQCTDFIAIIEVKYVQPPETGQNFVKSQNLLSLQGWSDAVRDQKDFGEDKYRRLNLLEGATLYQINQMPGALNRDKAIKLLAALKMFPNRDLMNFVWNRYRLDWVLVDENNQEFPSGAD